MQGSAAWHSMQYAGQSALGKGCDCILALPQGPLVESGRRLCTPAAGALLLGQRGKEGVGRVMQQLPGLCHAGLLMTPLPLAELQAR